MTRKLPASVEVPYGTLQCALTFSRPESQSGALAPTKSADLGREIRTLVLSQGNPFPYRRSGSFYQATRYQAKGLKTDYVNVTRVQAGTQQGAIGPVCMVGTFVPPFPGMFPSFGTLESFLSPWGAVGWDRTRPTKPVADLNVFLGELRDLPRNPFRVVDRVLKKASGLSRGAQLNVLRREIGSEYLNYDFGWRPFIEDTLKLLDFSERVSERLSRLSNSYREGRNIRRRITLSDTHETNTTSQYNNYGGSIGHIGGSGTWYGTMVTTTGVKQKIWYAAGYRMRVDLSDPLHVRSARRALLGATPTLGQVWSLTPWSWLAGWFSNVGNVIQNFTDPLKDYYAAGYACVMMERETYTQRDLTVSRTDASFQGTKQVSLSAKAGIKLQTRIIGTPYGFGLTWDGLSPSQLATAAALGISRT